MPWTLDVDVIVMDGARCGITGCSSVAFVFTSSAVGRTTPADGTRIDKSDGSTTDLGNKASS